MLCSCLHSCHLYLYIIKITKYTTNLEVIFSQGFSCIKRSNIFIKHCSGGASGELTLFNDIGLFSKFDPSIECSEFLHSQKTFCSTIKMAFHICH